MRTDYGILYFPTHFQSFPFSVVRKHILGRSSAGCISTEGVDIFLNSNDCYCAKENSKSPRDYPAMPAGSFVSVLRRGCQKIHFSL